jgi:rhomboid protease GluP
LRGTGRGWGDTFNRLKYCGKLIPAIKNTGRKKMNVFISKQLENEFFQSSKLSQIAKVKKWFLLFGIISIGLFAVFTKQPLNSFIFLFTTGITLLFFGAIYLVLHHQVKPGQNLVSLKTDCIESILFPGKQKTFYWKNISNVSIENIGNGLVLQLQLNPQAGFADKRDFWTGQNKSRPYFPLALFSALDQEKIFESILQRVRCVNPQAPLTNILMQERVFSEKLIALAPWTWVTYALVCINAGVWLLMVIKGADVTQPSAEMLLQWGGNAASEVQRGQWWRIISATFLHSGLMHLAINMLGLWSIGKTVERIYGHRSYLMIYIGSAITGSALSLHFSAQKAVSVGASGAVFGIAGALLVAVYKHRQTLPKIFGKQNLTGMGFFVFYSLLQGFTHAGIDNGAHVGGLLAGCLMAYILPERFDMQHYVVAISRRSAVALVAAIGLSTSIALSATPAHVDIQRVFSGVKAFNRGISLFDEATELTQNLQAQVKAGRMTEIELDEKTRTVLAPAYRKAIAEFSQAWLPPDDPRNELLQEFRQFTPLLVEGLAMESIVENATSKISPADPERAKVLHAETEKSAHRLEKILEKLKMSAKNKK